jgi:hypothetical protein
MDKLNPKQLAELQQTVMQSMGPNGRFTIKEDARGIVCHRVFV